MNFLVAAFLDVVLTVLGLYQFAIVVYVIMGWLEAFNIINQHNAFVYNLHTFLFRIIEPALVPIRRVIPIISGFDLSVLVLLLAVSFMMRVIGRLIY